jgi:hypothetical protein
VAELERELIVERTRAGLAAARRRGRQIGAKAAIEPQVLTRARRLRASGRTLRQIADLLGAKRSTLSRALRGEGTYARPAPEDLFAPEPEPELGDLSRFIARAEDLIFHPPAPDTER